MKYTLLFTLVIPLLAATGCQKQTAAQVLQEKRKGDLTREVAAEILNEHLASFSVQKLSFQSDGGIERAEQDGVVEKQHGLGGPDRIFTSSGLDMVGTVISENAIHYEIFGDRQYYRKYTFRLQKGVGMRVSKVTGVADGQGPSTKIVEYVTEYLLPAEMQPMTRYIYSGSKESRAFRKYDDGWRVSK